MRDEDVAAGRQAARARISQAPPAGTWHYDLRAAAAAASTAVPAPMPTMGLCAAASPAPAAAAITAAKRHAPALRDDGRSSEEILSGMIFGTPFDGLLSVCPGHDRGDLHRRVRRRDRQMSISELTQPASLRQPQHRDQPGLTDQIPIRQRRGHRRHGMRRSHSADALLEPEHETFDKPHFPSSGVPRALKEIYVGRSSGSGAA